MKKDHFKKFGPPPTLLSVSPKGTIEALPFHKNNNSPVQMRRGKLILAAHLVDEGWISLAKAYADDSRPQVVKHGMRAYKDWLNARKAKRAEYIAGHTHADGSFREKFKPFPRHLLPEEVVARLEGRGSNAVESFVPGIPGIEEDLHEEALAMEPGPRGGKKPTAIEAAPDPEVQPAPKPSRRRRTSASDSSDGKES